MKQHSMSTFFLTLGFLTSIAIAGACGGNGDDSGDDSGDDTVGDDSGDDSSGDDSGDDSSGDDSGDDSSDLPRQGTVCFGNPDCQTSETNLICVVDKSGDDQGICMFVCESFSQCLNNPDALERFETDCCQVQGGTRVCGNEDNFPEGACD